MADDSIISKDVAGAPIWIWGAAVGGAVILFSYLKSRSASTATTEVSSADTTPLDSSLNDFTQSGSASTASTTPLTNSQWITNALSYLEQSGYDPLTALNALNDFVDGNTITPGSQEAQIVSSALANQGTPPDLNSGVSLSAPSTATPASGKLSFDVPDITGDIYQDNAIADSSYVAGLYNAYKSNQTNATQQAYEAGYNQFVSSPEGHLDVTVPGTTS